MAAPQPLPGVAVWEACLETLNLTQESTTEKIEALDAFLDTVELLVETWATTYGA